MMQEQRYTGEGWDDIPLPDADTAWQKMEALLDGKKRRRAVPFWVWGMAVGGLVVSGFWLLSKEGELTTSTTTQSAKQSPNEKTASGQPGNASPVRQPASAQTASQQSLTDDSDQPTAALASPAKTSQLQSLLFASNASPKKTKSITKAVMADKPITNRSRAVKDHTNAATKATTSADEPPLSLQPIITAEEKQAPILKPDSTSKTVDTAKAIVATPTVEKKAIKKGENRLAWSAGIGLQQAIAVAGQSSSSYNYNGHRASLSDRIPSVYLRAEKGKWFAQLEALYAAPQPVRSFYFSQHSRYDAANANLQTERFAIQKLYYHQLLVSINYHLLPNLSIGIGGSYNILAGAVTEQEVTSKNVSSGAETTTNKLAPVKGYKDSFLYKTTAGVLLQTDYHIKRFSLGLRYTQNLQPFIKYTAPDGKVMDEKTGVLQAVLRFRLWRNK